MRILGLMSGTSLDGLDLALCEFDEKEGSYHYQILKSETIPYSEEWRSKLGNIANVSAEAFFALNVDYSKLVANQVNAFLINEMVPDAIASHGHTVFHQPRNGFTVQIGSCPVITAVTGINSVGDFRSLDVALGGQGAPLVPVGDEHLFSNYDACLNIGGIANISFKDPEGNRIAFDICVANMALNELSLKLGKPYDHNGDLARSGKTDKAILNVLNAMPYFTMPGAKSIGREWFESQMRPLLKGDPENLLATCTRHIATVIAGVLNKNKLTNVLVTGGGAFNKFLTESISASTDTQLIIPDEQTVNFKEALIFAFLGYLRLQNKVNTLRSVTGATQDSCGGTIYLKATR
jgi:anhydro-N-acetylmuramic acid kinase